VTEPSARRRRRRRAWQWIKFIVGLALAALALWAVTNRRDELSGATGYLAHVRWDWLILAACAELASLVAFAVVQRRLLAAGDVDMSLDRLTAVTLASTAIANSIPAGPIVSSVFQFRQYRRHGADDTLAAWILGALFVTISVTLAVIAAGGLAIAGAEGAGLDLVGITVGVLLLALAMGALFVQRRALVWLVTGALRTSVRWLHRPRRDVDAFIDRIVERLNSVTLTGRQVAAVAGWGMANWLLDCGCLVLSFLAVGVGVPWKGLLLAYGAGQLAANLPVTPGGLGVVEGSLTIALAQFGGAEAGTIAAVLLYRILSFWVELPVGWITWAALALVDRHRDARLEPVPVPEGAMTTELAR
jgi:uncharacterized protein (TIRG00374 family)